MKKSDKRRSKKPILPDLGTPRAHLLGLSSSQLCYRNTSLFLRAFILASCTGILIAWGPELLSPQPIPLPGTDRRLQAQAQTLRTQWARLSVLYSLKIQDSCTQPFSDSRVLDSRHLLLLLQESGHQVPFTPLDIESHSL